MQTTTYYSVLYNGNAEFNYVSDYATHADPWAWTVDYGSLTAVAYSIGTATDLNSADSAAIGGGNAYFAGGPGGNARAHQDFDISAWASATDSGNLHANFSGDFGGYLSQADGMQMSLIFLAADKTTVLGSATLNGASAADRGNQTELLERDGSTVVPSGTRWVEIRLDATRTDGSYNDAYADNLSLVFTGENIPGGFGIVTATHDYSGETVGPLRGLLFQASANATVSFGADQFSTYDTDVLGDAYANVVSLAVDASHSFDATSMGFSNWTSGVDMLKIAGTNAADSIAGSWASDSITGGAGNDTIDLSQTGPNAYDHIGQGGADTVNAGIGDDTILVGSDFGLCKINGGAGNDIVHFLRAPAAAVSFKSATLKDVELIKLDDVGTYNFKTVDANVAAGATLTVDGSALAQPGSEYPNALYFNGSKETDGHFVLIGGLLMPNHLTGGALSDVLKAGASADQLTGHGGNDTFEFDYLPHQPTITDFAHGDIIDLHNIDADYNTGGDQAFHLGKTAGHVGDTVIAYNALADRTTISLYDNGDNVADAVIKLNGNHSDLTAADFLL